MEESKMAESKMPGVLAFDMDAKAEEQPDFPVLTYRSDERIRLGAKPGGFPKTRRPPVNGGMRIAG